MDLGQARESSMSNLEEDLIRATLRGLSRSVVLWLVSKKPRSGYEVTKELKRLTGRRFHAGVVYPILYELEKKRYIVGRWTRKGRRRVRYYSVTKKVTAMIETLRELFEMPVREALKDLLGEGGQGER